MGVVVVVVDCSVIGCRLVVIIEDLLWVLTDAQLTAAVHFLHSISHLIEKSQQQGYRAKARKKLEVSPHPPS